MRPRMSSQLEDIRHPAGRRYLMKGYVFMFLFLISHLASALSTDRDQILQVRANSADLNQQTHQGIYLGDVQLDQGTTHIRAVEATTTGNEKNQLVLAVIKGDKTSQAHYWTLIDEKKPPVHAYADTINYYPDKHLIELIGNARVEQGTNSFTAPTIRYDTLAQHVIAQPDKSGRTTIIFHPEKHT